MNKPLHRKIFEHVQCAILEGRYRPGQRLPTDAQWVREFATSRPTVARAMRDLEQAGYLERRPGSGSYVRLPERGAQQLLGLLIPRLGETEIFEPICGEIARAAQRHQFSLLWGDSGPAEAGSVEQQSQRLCRAYIEQKVAGVFFAPVELTAAMHELNHQIAEELDRARIAVVLLDRDLENYPRRSRFDLVGIDNRRAGYVQTAHLLSLGCRHVEYVGVPLSAPTVDARIAGYQDALREAGISPEAVWVRRGDPGDEGFLRELTGKLPEGFVCGNDITAAQLMHGLIRRGIRVPDDVRVVGLDDVKYARLLSVPLTTIRQPCRDLGAAAVMAMVQRIEHRGMPPRDICVDFELVVRDSCGARRGQAASGPLR